jgi:hypothetical protein
MKIECATCKYGGNCKHPLRKKTEDVDFCLGGATDGYRTYGHNHPKYSGYKKVRPWYEYTYWEPRIQLSLLLTDEDFEI